MKFKIDILWRFLLGIVRNKYLVVFLGFAVWISFLDTYNLVDRIKNLQKLNELKKEVEFFRAEIETYKTQYNELFSTKQDLEKFAREQFSMKEDDEDVFVIVAD